MGHLTTIRRFCVKVSVSNSGSSSIRLLPRRQLLADGTEVYYFPMTYSCRVPMSSTNSALALPAPGPATVRLAMIRSGIELFGKAYVRDELFPILRSAEVCIKPPAKVAISTHLLRSFKATSGNPGAPSQLMESLAYREFCHAQGEMTLYIKIPVTYKNVCCKLLEMIGYWGQANSLAYCVNITCGSPKIEECGMPLKRLTPFRSMQNLFSCIVSDFRDEKVEWDEIMPVMREKESTAIRLDVWVWPLVISEQWSTHKLLVRRSLV
jgi:hypothetical protein